MSTAIEPPLSEAAAEAWIPRTCFKNGPPSQVGVELELLVVDARHPDGLRGTHYPRHRYPALLRELAAGGLDGRLTVEPGGQVELSSRPGPNLSHTIEWSAGISRRCAAARPAAAPGWSGWASTRSGSPRRLGDEPTIRGDGALLRSVGTGRPQR